MVRLSIERATPKRRSNRDLKYWLGILIALVLVIPMTFWYHVIVLVVAAGVAAALIWNLPSLRRTSPLGRGLWGTLAASLLLVVMMPAMLDQYASMARPIRTAGCDHPAIVMGNHARVSNGTIVGFDCGIDAGEAEGAVIENVFVSRW